MHPPGIELGRILTVHGLAGEVVVRTTGDSPQGIGSYPSLLWESVRGDERELELESCRAHKGMALVKFRGYSDRARAEELIGGSLKIPRERLKPAGPDRYYIADLIGLSVETAEGRRIGVVRDVLQTGANDVYVVDVEGREVLVPAVDHVVKSIDLARGRLVIDLVDGLLD